AKAAWNKELSKIEVSGGTDEQTTNFYTALYHTMIHPNVFNEFSAETIWNFGGGRQTYGLLALIAQEHLPCPKHIVIADTGYESQVTWDYFHAIAEPVAQALGIKIQVLRSNDKEAPDIYTAKGMPKLPVFTNTGHFRPYCSGEWKRDRIKKWEKEQKIPKEYERWIGFSADEGSRVARMMNSKTEKRRVRFPLWEMMLTSKDAENLCEKMGWGTPPRSSCYMCPHRRNYEWRTLKETQPEEWNKAVAMDRELNEQGYFLHDSRKPLDQVDISKGNKPTQPDCGLGICFI
ncbi:MAG: glycoside hydrolase domain-containing protein, partial [Limisphaerales bacterium]